MDVTIEPAACQNRPTTIQTGVFATARHQRATRTEDHDPDACGGGHRALAGFVTTDTFFIAVAADVEPAQWANPHPRRPERSPTLARP